MQPLDYAALQEKLATRRAELAEKYPHGVPDDRPKECEKCRGAGVVLMRMPHHDDPEAPYREAPLVPCPACGIGTEMAQRQALAAVKRSGLDEWIGVEFSTSPPLAGQEPYWHGAHAWMLEGDGILYVCGKYHTGKTRLAVCIAKEWFRLYGEKTLFRNVPTMLQDLRGLIAGEQAGDIEKGAFNDAIRDLQECPYLVLDDYGMGRVTEWGHSQLYLILNSRLVARRSTVITSNLTADDLSNHPETERFGTRVLGNTAVTYMEFELEPLKGVGDE